MIEKLISAKICFAVVISQSSFKVPHLDISGKDIFLVVSEKDNKFAFEKSETIPGMCEYDLDEDDYEDFRTNHSEKFEKVLHSEEGRVYELKQNSFSKRFKMQT